MIKHDFLKIWEATKAKILNAIFYRKGFIFDTPLKEQKSLFTIMSGLSQRPDKIYHLWKFTLGGP